MVQKCAAMNVPVLIAGKRVRAGVEAGTRSSFADLGQTLAELGFIVVQIDGMGTPWRSKKFHEAYFGDMGDNTLPDQVAAMQAKIQQLATEMAPPLYIMEAIRLSNGVTPIRADFSVLFSQGVD